MYADTEVGARTVDMQRVWAVVVQAYVQGEAQERGVTDSLNLLEAIDYAQDLRSAFQEEGWEATEQGGYLKDGRTVYIFVDGSNGGGVWGS